MISPIPKLSLRGINKSFHSKAGSVHVLNGLELDVYEQDFLSIIGPSGCGKTTVFNIIAGLIHPDQGDIYMDGRHVTSLRGKVGYMMQRDLLLPWRTVLENVVLGLELRGVPLKESRERALDYLRTFGLAGFENAYPRTLSGGMKQRAALIRTLICDPEIILLDEPFSALDYQTRLYLEGVLVDAVKTFKKTVVLVTHDIDEAVALSNRVIVLSGRPAKVKMVHEIDIAEHSPVEARADPRFSEYFNALCAELDIQTHVKH
ncbi:ABC transporter ATP-binding protein [Pelomicrobium methylotrophicum]|uniref:ABC transporter ATP-binding protein n=1 Tax=Pelomicrobium methylotrophicum TaxID=2602750 RepID=A0A5C7EI98_9PROT|nr:ABC transporter ATP-binding protein [Pelomicrobium methylotrophicum]TXF10585.1 ABC transporter ATP-binding protein [Pelomicrobium methylotrophicum]